MEGKGEVEYYISQTCDQQQFEARSKAVFSSECLNTFATGFKLERITEA